MREEPKASLRKVRTLNGEIIQISPKVNTAPGALLLKYDLEESKSKKPKHVKGKASHLLGTQSFTERTKQQQGWSCVIL